MSIMVGVPLLFLILACYIAASSTCVVLVVDAWILSSSSSPMTHPVSSMKTTTATGYYQQQHNTYSSFSFSSSRLNSAVEDSVDVDNEVDNVSLPDFGKTTVEVDTIKLVKKRRKKKVEEEKTDDSLYDTTDGVPAKDNNNSVSEKWRRTDLMGTSLIDAKRR
ncbi:hypothetical protein FRACYDRAFT_251555 [Fragilariopsis cylindrus CCMP1102]|uniref:Uncharacterized protein n=1 Tax=Fragilariopsis cylindrus CCMP1102 TaxID=635003 RepID=A0A1E7EMQ1_9STRA|nr:hypothetical protein FRACYDRAFT_251555 [Fragilariopsis cylindrus CCMP1102]|eukprot:OEU07210.1 hypothetical protein FRACYDRAFT_251555 [Fragilariopsis cylindrus CCMP1102]